jgi:hypothetical protein
MARPEVPATDDDEGLPPLEADEDEDIPPLEDIDGAADEAPKMEEVTGPPEDSHRRRTGESEAGKPPSTVFSGVVQVQWTDDNRAAVVHDLRRAAEERECWIQLSPGDRVRIDKYASPNNGRLATFTESEEELADNPCFAIQFEDGEFRNYHMRRNLTLQAKVDEIFEGLVQDWNNSNPTRTVEVGVTEEDYCRRAMVSANEATVQPHAVNASQRPGRDHVVAATEKLEGIEGAHDVATLDRPPTNGRSDDRLQAVRNLLFTLPM